MDASEQLLYGARVSAQQPRRFSNDGPAGEQRPRQVLECRDASFVMFVRARENGNQRPGIDQDTPHLLFPDTDLPKPSKWRRLVLRSLGACFAVPMSPPSCASS